MALLENALNAHITKILGKAGELLSGDKIESMGPQDVEEDLTRCVEELHEAVRGVEIVLAKLRCALAIRRELQ